MREARAEPPTARAAKGIARRETVACGGVGVRISGMVAGRGEESQGIVIGAAHNHGTGDGDDRPGDGPGSVGCVFVGEWADLECVPYRRAAGGPVCGVSDGT